ncbi:hypothetical protein A4G99_02980 [Haladaptatus sp. R4]|uniref:hypothetical protein n=1 Tax=Haladaptatus sp. R4 TaxID=1679489 RepID=UPI0007B4A920|nr:hypothetical protein [Haladaptatus sp. R4]KZN25467.1 hypothetical protein A4G99_02980 [Haladaptatus sp. R4]
MASNSTSSLGSASTGESAALVVTRTETVPAGVPVRSYDELSDTAQGFLAEFDGHEKVVRMTSDVSEEFTEDTVIVFNDYLRVDVA